VLASFSALLRGTAGEKAQQCGQMSASHRGSLELEERPI
jgi:hypothetical protein